MDGAVLRQSFLAYVGQQRFRKFVRVLNKSPVALDRLRYWQEQLWIAFIHVDSRWPSDFKLVREAFRICEVHDCGLIKCRVYASKGRSQWTQTDSPNGEGPNWPMESNPKEFADFPYPGWGEDPSAFADDETTLWVVWYCPQCRSLRAAWESKFGRIDRRDRPPPPVLAE